MRTVTASAITDTVARLCIQANLKLPEDVSAALARSRQTEPWPLAKTTLDLLWDNMELADQRQLPICQDTGMACVFVELGQDVHIEGDFEQAVHEGVRRGYGEGYLRKSIVADPLRRVNTGDNTPAAITLRLVPGDGLSITVAPKGFGSENMSRLAMLKPADGVQGVKDFVIETVRLAGPNPCPPIILGIGIGGSFDKVAGLSKHALLRPIDRPNPDPFYAGLEQEILDEDQRPGHRAPGLRRPHHLPGPVHRNGPYPCGRSARGGERKLPRHPPGQRPAVREGHTMEYQLTTPVTREMLAPLRAGDTVLLSGTVYTARDAAHKRMMELLDAGKPLPFPVEGSAVYYVGPTPERPGQVIGSAGPTTSGRMDAYSPRLLDLGQAIMIGKGARNQALKDAVVRNGAVYLAALGGAGALMAASVKELEVICWEDLGCEAVRRLEVKDFPLTVILDAHGGDLYQSGPAAYLASL